MNDSVESGMGSMHCSDVADVLEQEGLAPLPEPAREHVAACPACQGLLADFGAIVGAAHELPAEAEPPARLWISLRAQLEAEGIIHEDSPVAVDARIAPAASPWWHSLSRWFQGRALATAAVGLLIMAAGIAQLRQPVNLQTAPPSQAAEPAQTPDPLAASGAALTEQEHVLRSVQPAGTLASSPVDDSLQQNLQTLDAFIADCEHHLKTNPRDQLAREYLAGAYQQKAELLSEMLDRGRSVN
ncbi:MAG: anti-sigma factor [Candidatus Acidiferrum sp.]|jgi:hypothetical protein